MELLIWTILHLYEIIIDITFSMHQLKQFIIVDVGKKNCASKFIVSSNLSTIAFVKKKQWAAIVYQMGQILLY